MSFNKIVSLKQMSPLHVQVEAQIAKLERVHQFSLVMHQFLRSPIKEAPVVSLSKKKRSKRGKKKGPKVSSAYYAELKAGYPAYLSVKFSELVRLAFDQYQLDSDYSFGAHDFSKDKKYNNFNVSVRIDEFLRVVPALVRSFLDELKSSCLGDLDKVLDDFKAFRAERSLSLADNYQLLHRLTRSIQFISISFVTENLDKFVQLWIGISSFSLSLRFDPVFVQLQQFLKSQGVGEKLETATSIQSEQYLTKIRLYGQVVQNLLILLSKVTHFDADSKNEAVLRARNKILTYLKNTFSLYFGFLSQPVKKNIFRLFKQLYLNECGSITDLNELSRIVDILGCFVIDGDILEFELTDTQRTNLFQLKCAYDIQQVTDCQFVAHNKMTYSGTTRNTEVLQSMFEKLFGLDVCNIEAFQIANRLSDQLANRYGIDLGVLIEKYVATSHLNRLDMASTEFDAPDLDSASGLNQHEVIYFKLKDMVAIYNMLLSSVVTQQMIDVGISFYDRAILENLKDKYLLLATTMLQGYCVDNIHELLRHSLRLLEHNDLTEVPETALSKRDILQHIGLLSLFNVGNGVSKMQSFSGFLMMEPEEFFSSQLTLAAISSLTLRYAPNLDFANLCRADWESPPEERTFPSIDKFVKGYTGLNVHEAEFS